MATIMRWTHELDGYEPVCHSVRPPQVLTETFPSHCLLIPFCFRSCMPGEATPCKVSRKGQGT